MRRILPDVGLGTGYGLPVPITVSVGAALSSQGENSFDKLYQKADQALYHAKRRGKNRVAVYGREIMLEEENP